MNMMTSMMTKRSKIVKCCSDLYLFYRLFITSRFSDNYPARHIKNLSRELMKLSKGEDVKRLCVSMPPRHSKSSLITISYPLWLLFQNPDLNILIITNGGDLAEKFGIQLREYFKIYGEYFNIHLSDVKHSSTYLMFENSEGELYNGSIRLVGAGGSITGQDADYLIIDDPYKGFDDITPTLLNKKIEWFNTIVEQRIEPHTKLLILHTRWHNNDLQGYLKKNFPEDYKFISLPALNKDNTPLWSEVYTTQELLAKKEKVGERIFQAVYQQEPLDVNADFFNMDKIHFHPPEDYVVEGVVRSWDLASSDEERKNDYTVGIKAYKTENGLIITDMVRGRFGHNTKNIILSTAETDTPTTTVCVETGVAAAGNLLYDTWREQLTGYKVEQSMPVGSKSDRATPLQNAIEDGLVYVDLTDDMLREEFIDEFKRFPLGEHDDIVDATAYAWNYFYNNKDKKTAKLGVVYI